MKKRIKYVTFATVIALVMILSIGISVSAAKGISQGNIGKVQTSQLNESEIDWLLYMREEEKLARDVYLELYDMWGFPVFQNIATSEQKHTDAIENLLDKYGIDDPVNDEDVRGDFTNTELEEMYQDLIVKGSISVTDAFEVGVMIEKVDIADLEDALTDSDNNNIERVYDNLLRGSNNHLIAFSSHLD